MSSTFWSQFGAQVAAVTLQVGEEVGLAFLQGFLNHHFGTNAPVVFAPPAPPTMTGFGNSGNFATTNDIANTEKEVLQK